MTHLQNLAEILKNEKVIIQTHNCPDPDAIASAFGLQFALKNMGIESKLVYDGEMGKLAGSKLLDYLGVDISSLADATDEGEISESNLVVLVDSQKYNVNITDIDGDEVACIDHHPTVIDCEYQYKDIRLVGSCSSIIASYIKEENIELTSEVATALLFGLKMDTSDFKRGVTEFDIEMFYYLYPFTDKLTLEKLSVNNINITDLRAYGAAINNISIYKNIGFACIPFNCPDGLVAIICDFILALDVVDFAVVFCNREGSYKFSVRSLLPELNAGTIIRQAFDLIGGGSGGGHSFMSGGFMPHKIISHYNGRDRLVFEQAFIKCIYPEDRPKTYRVIEDDEIK